MRIRRARLVRWSAYAALVLGASGIAGLRADRQLRADLLQQARMVAASICPDRAAALTGTPADLGTPPYLHFKQRLAEIRQALPDCRFAYLMTRLPSGAVVFLVDNKPDDSPDGSPPGQVYTNLTAALLAVLADGQPVVEGPQFDAWGTWVSALTPVSVPERSRPILLGLDIDARRWQWIVAAKAAVPAGLGTVAILLALLVAELLASRRSLRARQAELETSAQRFAELAERSRTLVWEVDPHGLYSYISPACLPVLGYRPDEMIGRLHFYDLHPPEENETFKRTALQMIARHEPIVNVETAVRTQDGRRIWLLTNGYPVHNADGTLRGYRGNNVDITERKQAEAALRASETQLKTILDHIPASIALLDQEHRVLWANRTAADSVGRQPGDMIGQPCHVFWADPAQPCGDCPAVAAIRTRRECRHVVHTPDGRAWDESGVPLLDDAGQVTAVVEIALDVTERIATDARLRSLLEESNQARQALLGILEDHERAEADLRRLATAIEQSADSIVVTDAQAVIQYVNPAFEAVTGYRREEALGQNPRILQSGKQDAAFYRQMWTALAAGQTWKGRLVNRRKDGTLYTEEAVISPVVDAQGRIANYVAVKRDVSEQLRLSAQLLQAQKMDSIGRLAGGVAHDFNNMLGVILGRTGMALEQIPPTAPLRTDLEEIQRAAERSADLTRQLLAFARKQTVAPRILRLNETIAGMLQMLKRLIGENIELAWRPQAVLWPVRIDPVQIDQILANLCVNARDAITGIGKIVIETGNEVVDQKSCAEHAGFVSGEYAWLTVSDNGCGMAPETLAHIFEPFFTTKGIGEGTGLGLATVYGIVKQNNGYISVTSRPGLGTRFKIYLPRHADKAAHHRQKGPGPVPQGHETILLVEDEPAILQITKKMLERQGYLVLAASTPGAAIHCAREYAGEIHLLMTDVVMPEMNGRDLAQNLFRLYPRIKCLFMSGYPANVIAPHGVLDQGVHFIQKPFVQRELSARIREALDSRDT